MIYNINACYVTHSLYRYTWEVWGSGPDSCKKVNHSLSHFGFAVHIKALLLFSHEVISDSATSCTITRQTPLSSTISRSLFKFMSIESVILSNRFILCHPLLLLPSVFLSTRVFQWVSSSHQVAKVLELKFQHQSLQWIFRANFLCNWLVWSPCCPRDSQESSPAHNLKAPILWYSAFFMVQLSIRTRLQENHIFDYTDLCWQSDVSAF